MIVLRNNQKSPINKKKIPLSRKIGLASLIVPIGAFGAYYLGNKINGVSNAVSESLPGTANAIFLPKINKTIKDNINKYI